MRSNARPPAPTDAPTLDTRLRIPVAIATTTCEIALSNPLFGKTRLRSVPQICCNGLFACPATGPKHTFAYVDDVATAGSGFDTAAKWDTGANPSSGGTAAYTNQELSGLGSSMTDAGDGKIYVGFNIADRGDSGKSTSAATTTDPTTSVADTASASGSTRR
ncbi:hypothetical protein ASH01_08270 [Terrabacter sp. Soil811]|uniref:hypothetical protein n=1 Tax=Terrabacter sp. Soil811 TaxID=1736419 RepID=UPI0006FB31E9|nr:hypothetical protein [Terrabacter sp. Soil811]KRF45782.1 hypothetical protein ASH01_08270 [Terrabacter sp. Soil811]